MAPLNNMQNQLARYTKVTASFSVTVVEDIVRYWLVVTPDAVKVDKNGHLSDDYLVCQVMSQVGEEPPELTTEMTVKYERNGGTPEIYGDPVRISPNDDTVTFYLYSQDKVIDSKKVVISKDGTDRPLIYPAGSYLDEKEYQRTDDTCPFVEQDGKYYLMNRVGTWSGSPGNTPADIASSSSSDKWWISIPTIEATFVKVLFAKFAKLGSAIFNGDITMSQHGILNGQPSSDYWAEGFIPNIKIDWLTGYFEALVGKFRGTLVAERLYTPFTELILPVTWNPAVHSTNISFSNPGAYVSSERKVLTLPDADLTEGVELHILPSSYSRSQSNSYVMIEGAKWMHDRIRYTYYILPGNQITRISSVRIPSPSGQGRCQWFIENPIEKNFLDVF